MKNFFRTVAILAVLTPGVAQANENCVNAADYEGSLENMIVQVDPERGSDFQIVYGNISGPFMVEAEYGETSGVWRSLKLNAVGENSGTQIQGASERFMVCPLFLS